MQEYKVTSLKQLEQIVAQSDNPEHDQLKADFKALNTKLARLAELEAKFSEKAKNSSQILIGSTEFYKTHIKK